MTESSIATLVQMDRVSKIYTSGFLTKKTVPTVKNVSFEIRRGETLGLVGESGCGKTTIGRILLMLAKPTEGTIRFDGIDLTQLSRNDLRSIRPRMQILFQDPDTSLNPRMNIRDSITEPMEIWGTGDSGSRARRIAELMELVGLQPELAARYPWELSGGQKQRAVLARVLALNPEFLVADEPTSALDLSVQAQVLSLLKEMQRSRNLTMLFISHDLSVVRVMSDRIAVMYRGEIVEIAATEDLFRDPVHPYTRELVEAERRTESELSCRSPRSGELDENTI
ncbi:MAG: ATP-binding cassette domain-containing protein [Methanoregulaceae archaeon]